MQFSFIKHAAAVTFAAGIIFGQGTIGNEMQPGGPGAPGVQEGRRYMRGEMNLDHVSQALNLTDAQKEKAKAIFEQAKESTQPIREELRQNREKLNAAAKVANNDSNVEKLATDQGRLLGKLIAIRTQAHAKFYQMLTPEQRVKADQMHEQFRQKVRSETMRPGSMQEQH